MNFFGSLFSDDHGSNLGNGDSRQGIGGATLNGQGETWGKQILLYKEANRIDLLKKNEFDKSILKWISDLCLQNSTFFSNKVLLELGAGSGLASISLFTHANIFSTELIKE
ncbi:hypothetical protein PCYB_006030 [Plasmodium cynomolgi strain B]|uniref:Uncharacterized protein n=1 Tax=Plasmodium cynomolgi (strain B) TaxID=1120755 RepID=K6V0J5_PLACD|nr:hypothetical protein PCYB_006030 [Plasmodium cynomolgi strain B]GAB69854.1 hypothetical protein PCYB_006030 [Plasmodium cynomolgi strain B]